MSTTSPVASVGRDRIAETLVVARHRRRMSQRELAERAGVAPNTVLRAESGKGVRDSSLAAMLDALEVDPSTVGQDAAAEAATAADVARAFVEAGPTADERHARMLHVVRSVAAYA